MLTRIYISVGLALCHGCARVNNVGHRISQYCRLRSQTAFH